MKLTADTNLLVRALVADDPDQSRLAIECLEKADLVAIPLQTLCEMVWVLERAYGVPRVTLAKAIRTLVQTHNVVTNALAVECGLKVYEGGGDFADGVIAHEGQALGGEVFVSFDQKAVKCLKRLNVAAELLV